jgi:hypothetical protein
MCCGAVALRKRRNVTIAVCPAPKMRSPAGDAGNATGPSGFKRCSDKQDGGALSAKCLLLYNDRCTVTLAVRRTNLEKG